MTSVHTMQSSEVVVRETACKTILNRSGISDYCLNCYTGCAHGCVYCYARFMQRFHPHPEPWGAFVDAVTDRYSELFLFLGFLIYFTLHSHVAGILLAYLAAAGSVLVSYVKARADASKLDANVGLLTRVERYLVLIPGLIFSSLYPPLVLIALSIIAVFANITALQRIFRVRRDAFRQLSESQE